MDSFDEKQSLTGMKSNTMFPRGGRGMPPPFDFDDDSEGGRGRGRGRGFPPRGGRGFPPRGGRGMPPGFHPFGFDPENGSPDLIQKKDYLELELEQEKKLKAERTRTYTDKEILFRSIKFSLSNWKFMLFFNTTFLIEQYFNIYSPIIKSKMIDAVSVNKNLNSLKKSFKKFIIFESIRFFFKMILELINYFYIKDAMDDYSFIVLKSVSEKDIEFFDLYKTGEIIEKIRTSEESINKNILSKGIATLQEIAKAFIYIYYMYKTSIKLAIISMIIFMITGCVQYFENKYSIFRQFRKGRKVMERYSSYLTEFVSNIRTVKSFGNEESEALKLQKLKKEMRPKGMGHIFFKILDTGKE